MKQKLQMMASEVTLSAQNRRHMTLSMRILSTRTNRNGHAVTERFIDKIVAGGQDYVCMPLCADVARLVAKDYGGLTHMYDERAGMFRAPQIGSFIELEKRYDEYGACLYGTARINKRDPRVTEAIMELYAAGALNVSFEIEAGTLEMRGDTLVVDDAEDNDLMGVCVVSVPAYPESEALSQVAEAKDRTCAMIGSAYIMLPEDMDLGVIYKEAHMAICEMLQIEEYSLMLLEVRAGYIVFRYGELQDKTYRADYVLSVDRRVLITEMYEVSYERVKQEGEMMFVNEMAAEVIEQVVEEMTVVEEQNAKIVVEAESEEGEPATVDIVAETEEVISEEAASDNEDIVIAEEAAAETEEVVVAEEEPQQKPDELETLKAELEELKREFEALKQIAEQKDEENTQLRAELDQMNNEKQEREDNERRENMRVFAQAQGLDIEDAKIASMIDTLNHEALMAEASKCGINKVASVTVRMEAELNSKPYGGLLERE